MKRIFTVFSLLLATTFSASAQSYGDIKAPQDWDATRVIDEITMHYAGHKRVKSMKVTLHYYVDLGLASGTLWATTNVGAENAWDYGDYFAWGETTTKTDYSWSTNKYSKGAYNKLTKYCNDSSRGYEGYTDSKTVLDPEDDAATANWGSQWRMPTHEEWTELRNSCYWVWTYNYSGSGKAGYIVFKAEDGDAGDLFTGGNPKYPYTLLVAHIFLPAAGHHYATSAGGVGGSGSYWSASLYAVNTSNGWFADLGYNKANIITKGREEGLSVRPVRRLNTSVDLGLTSGTQWATTNVGADYAWEYGDYFAWGETKPYYVPGHAYDNPCTDWRSGKTGYDWASYGFTNGAKDKLTKYCNKSSLGNGGFTDGKTVLDPEDDAATANWGSAWRMPTRVEWKELYNECYWEWTEDYASKGVSGYIVYKSVDKTQDKGRSKGSDHNYSAATDAHIFLPAAGQRNGANLNEAGWGNYLSASLDTEASYRAKYESYNANGFSDGLGLRCKGYSVRPVRR